MFTANKDKLVLAQGVASSALAAFTGVVADLDYAITLQNEVAAEEDAKAIAAVNRAADARASALANTKVQARIQELIGT